MFHVSHDFASPVLDEIQRNIRYVSRFPLEVDITELEVGYLMGLVVGEGSFTGDRKKYRFDINLHESDLQPLIAVKNLLGGRINGPYEHAGRKFWAYRIESRQLRAHLQLFYQQLPKSRKREQFLKWAEKWNLACWDT